MNPSEEDKALMVAIYRDKVRRARATPPEEKLFSGIEIFERVLGWMRAGVRHQFPGSDDAEVERIIAERLVRLRRLHERGLYQPVPPGTPRPS